VLRDAVSDLPPSIRDRRGKQGFTFPFEQWLAGPLRPKLGELVETAEEHLRDYLRPGVGRLMLTAFDHGRAHWSQPWAFAALCATLPTPATAHG
jgi:hypothetical protein